MKKKERKRSDEYMAELIYQSYRQHRLLTLDIDPGHWACIYSDFMSSPPKDFPTAIDEMEERFRNEKQ